MGGPDCLNISTSPNYIDYIVGMPSLTRSTVIALLKTSLARKYSLRLLMLHNWDVEGFEFNVHETPVYQVSGL